MRTNFTPDAIAEEAIRAPYRQQINNLNFEIQTLKEQRQDLMEAVRRAQSALLNPLQEMGRYTLLEPHCFRLRSCAREIGMVLDSVGTVQTLPLREGRGYIERFTLPAVREERIIS